MSENPGRGPAEVDFGYERVAWHEKKQRVGDVFDSVAPRYDVMNDVMSLGLHRIWKHFTIARTGLRSGDYALDVAAGSGDLSIPMARRVGSAGRLVVSDINANMLAVGRDRLLDAGVAGNVEYAIADAESLPMRDRSFDCVTIGFGLRNVTDKQRALREFFRVLRPGGRLVVLEFSQLQVRALEPVYDAYSFQVLPRLGRVLAGDADSYRYLAESIRRHPDQESLLRMFEEAGFERCDYFNLTLGMVAVHVGFRF
ncbi:MAG: bifunctional demethylmenaquinone methyltransferase/2-methoxy-6-polyprenyl-1,4-benzoquinol methylase UbiE [Gammaproteobacteria bacterium]